MKNCTRLFKAKATVITAFLLLSGPAVSQEAFEYKVSPIKDGITMLHGGGGNIAVLESERGLLVVDNGYEQNSKVLEETLKQFGAQTQFVLNTHWHGDHTGGNAELASDATIFAHTNVRVRMSAGSETADPKSLPVVTYEDGVTLNFANQTVRAMHLPAGHTDGDTAVYFEQANVMHTGDHMFKDWFPYVDKDSGGTVDGYINNVQAIMDMIDANTIVIPGHGPIAKLEDMQRFKDMIVATRAEVAALKASGLDLAAAQAKGLDAKWESWGTFFIKEDRWIATLWDDV